VGDYWVTRILWPSKTWESPTPEVYLEDAIFKNARSVVKRFRDFIDNFVLLWGRVTCVGVAISQRPIAYLTSWEDRSVWWPLLPLLYLYELEVSSTPLPPTTLVLAQAHELTADVHS
jgi:hypothetical protein